MWARDLAEADVIGALVEALKADSIVAALTADRVFGGELHKDEAKHMPRHAIVVALIRWHIDRNRLLCRARYAAVDLSHSDQRQTRPTLSCVRPDAP